MAEFLKIALPSALTAVAEIVGCYLAWLVLKQGKCAWLLLPAALSLAVFAWLNFVDGIALTRWDVAGAGIALAGMAVIALQPRVANPVSQQQSPALCQQAEVVWRGRTEVYMNHRIKPSLGQPGSTLLRFGADC